MFIYDTQVENISKLGLGTRETPMLIPNRMITTTPPSVLRSKAATGLGKSLTRLAALWKAKKKKPLIARYKSI
jgi:hypothetical protein